MCIFRWQTIVIHVLPLIIQDYCSWPYDKTYDTQSFVGHGNYDDPRLKMSHSGCTLVWHFQPRHPSVTFSTSGRRISMSHSLGTVHHLLNVTLFIDCYFGYWLLFWLEYLIKLASLAFQAGLLRWEMSLTFYVLSFCCHFTMMTCLHANVALSKCGV